MDLFPVGKLLNVSEVAETLGISEHTIRGWVFQNKIPYIKFGTGRKSLVKFNPNAINKWIEDKSFDEMIIDMRNKYQKKPKLNKASKPTIEKFNSSLEQIES